MKELLADLKKHNNFDPLEMRRELIKHCYQQSTLYFNAN